MVGGKKGNATVDRVAQLAAVLRADGEPSTKSNSVPQLLACMGEDNLKESQCRDAISALRCFFEAAYDKGQLVKAPASTSAAEDPLSTYRQWLMRQHTAYTTMLLDMLKHKHPSSLQVDALAALMEGIRGVDPGQLSTSLFDQCFTLLITSSTVHPRTLAAFLSSYCGLRDVQYAAMKCISSLCAGYREHRDGGGSVGGGVGVGGGGGGGSGEEGDTNKQGTKHTKNKKGTKQNGNSAGAAAAAGQGGGDAVAGTQAATGTQVDGTVLPVHDIARNVYDVLMHVYEHAFADSGGDDGEGPGVQYKTWSGVAEAGIAVAANRGERARDRRKRRKLQQQQQGEQQGGEQQQQQSMVNNNQNNIVTAAWANKKLFQRAYSAAWLDLLRMPLPDDVYRKVLLHAPDVLLLQLTNPLLLTDFLTWAIRKGGLTGMLALNSVFLLVTQHGLEYPKFYEQLYSLLTQEALKSKHRSRFFRLADVFLSSGMVPAYTAAAFAKRMARRALWAPPAGALIAIAFIHNILRRHPSCAVLLHNPHGAASTQEDVFDDTKRDPAESRAIESSLWEVEALKRHYNPQVAALTSALDKDFAGERKKIAELDLAPLLSASYVSMVDTELKRRTRTQVAVELHTEPLEGLFAGQQVPGWNVF